MSDICPGALPQQAKAARFIAEGKSAEAREALDVLVRDYPKAAQCAWLWCFDAGLKNPVFDMLSRHYAEAAHVVGQEAVAIGYQRLAAARLTAQERVNLQKDAALLTPPSYGDSPPPYSP